MAGATDDQETMRIRRVERLRDIAPYAGDSDSKLKRSSLNTRPPTRMPSWVAPLAAGALIVALVVAGAIYVTRSARSAELPGPPLVGKPLVIPIPPSAHVYCPSQPAWSPDGARFAIMAREVAVGGQGPCPHYADLVSGVAQRFPPVGGVVKGTPGALTLLVFDTRTGGFVRSLPLGDLEGPLCRGASYCGESGPTGVALSWSPDGVSLFAFSTLDVLVTGPGGQDFDQTRGALTFVRADGTGAPRTLLAYGRQTSTATSAGGGILPTNLYSPPLFTWDVTTGQATYRDMHEQAGNETVAYAPIYHMGSGSALAAGTSPTAVSVTPWSFGVLAPLNDEVAPAIEFRSGVWGWSSDGRYVIPNIHTDVRMTGDPVTPTAVPGLEGYYIPPFTSAPDAAVTAALRDMSPTTHVIYVARDARGARLAALACQEGGGGVLTIRATATGKALTSIGYAFPSASTSYGCTGDAEAINWSPDGSRVAMTDMLDNQIVIWQIPTRV